MAVEQGGTSATTGAVAARLANFGGQAPIPVNVRQLALKQVDEDLVNEGLIDKVGGQVRPAVQNALGWEKTMAIPTPGILVKGCLDDCDICEPEVSKLLELEITRKDLENQLLAKKIALLEKSQEYRCCPADEEETSPAA